MIALDSNILIYAHRRDSPWHDRAHGILRELAEDATAWAIPWHCIHEFLAISTHPRIFDPASTLAEALLQVEYWQEAPHLFLLSETSAYLPTFVDVATAARLAGPRLYDARIAATCLHHGIDELWTADRDFSRFPRLKTRNPLVS